MSQCKLTDIWFSDVTPVFFNYTIQLRYVHLLLWTHACNSSFLSLELFQPWTMIRCQDQPYSYFLYITRSLISLFVHFFSISFLNLMVPPCHSPPRHLPCSLPFSVLYIAAAASLPTISSLKRCVCSACLSVSPPKLLEETRFLLHCSLTTTTITSLELDTRPQPPS